MHPVALHPTTACAMSHRLCCRQTHVPSDSYVMSSPALSVFWSLTRLAGLLSHQELSLSAGFRSVMGVLGENWTFQDSLCIATATETAAFAACWGVIARNKQEPKQGCTVRCHSQEAGMVLHMTCWREQSKVWYTSRCIHATQVTYIALHVRKVLSLPAHACMRSQPRLLWQSRRPMKAYLLDESHGSSS